MRNEEIEALKGRLGEYVWPGSARDARTAIELITEFQSQLADCERELAEVMGALEVAAGRLLWCGSASPGCSDLAGKELAVRWADEARAFLEREKFND